MKHILLLSAAMLGTLFVSAQLKTTPVCPALYVDILDGKVNLLTPNSTAGEVKKALPCFTSTEDNGSCGTTVYYKDKDLFFYPSRNYIEIREKFKGRLSIPLMGASRNGLFKWLGLPKIKDVKWDAFQTQYGILILYYNGANKVNKIQFSTKNAETINLCQG